MMKHTRNRTAVEGTHGGDGQLVIMKSREEEGCKSTIGGDQT